MEFARFPPVDQGLLRSQERTSLCNLFGKRHKGPIPSLFFSILSLIQQARIQCVHIPRRDMPSTPTVNASAKPTHLPARQRKGNATIPIILIDHGHRYMFENARSAASEAQGFEEVAPNAWSTNSRVKLFGLPDAYDNLPHKRENRLTGSNYRSHYFHRPHDLASRPAKGIIGPHWRRHQRRHHQQLYFSTSAVAYQG